jgi:hypothetical protein
MAVTAQELEVLQSIIQAVTVDVVQRERNGTAAPLGQAALFAHRSLQPFVQEPRF